MRATSVWVLLMVGCGDDSGVDAMDAGRDSAMDVADAREVSVTGGSCAEDVDCVSGLSCFRGPEGAQPWPGGYCTRDCAQDADCPRGTRCGPLYFDGDTPVTMCMSTCERNDVDRGGCREGYGCAWDGVCSIGCTEDAHCQVRDFFPPPFERNATAVCDVRGQCLLGSPRDDVPLGSPCTFNQQCSQLDRCLIGGCARVFCDVGGRHACPDGWVCKGEDAPWDVFATLCTRGCEIGVDGSNGVNPDDACPDGWVCYPAASDASGNATDSYCSPGSFGATPDAQVGDPCTTTADCAPWGGLSFCLDTGFCSTLFCDAPTLPESLRGCPGNGARCVVTELDPRVVGRVRATFGTLGSCLRDCSEDPDVCAPGTTCELGSCI